MLNLRKKINKWQWVLILLAGLMLPTPLFAQSGVIGRVTQTVWARDGSQVAVGTESGTIWVWDAETWLFVGALTGHQGRITNLTWSPEGVWLASGSRDGTVRVWDAVTWDELATLEIDAPISAVVAATSTPSPTATTATTTAAPATSASPLTFETFGTWRRGDQPYGTFSQTSSPVQEGDAAGTLTYDFSDATTSDDFVIFTQPSAVSGTPTRIQVWVYGDGSGHFFNVWLEDANGEAWSVPMGMVSHTGWRQMSGAIDADAEWPGGRLYGPDNGTIDYPIRFLGLNVDRIDGPTTGTIVFDDIAFGVADGGP